MKTLEGKRDHHIFAKPILDHNYKYDNMFMGSMQEKSENMTPHSVHNALNLDIDSVYGVPL